MRKIRIFEHISLDGVIEQDKDYSRFAWVYDPEGNRTELWEPK